MASPARSDLPTGTVTFLFTDVEGSTKLLHELGAEAYDDALIEHRRALREAFSCHGGVEVDTQGDAFFYAFPTADDALLAAGEGQAALAEGPIAVRMGLHTGTPHIGQEGYIGDDVHLGARIAAVAHGGQVVLSGETRVLIAGEITDLGEHRLKDIPEAVPVYQLGSSTFPPLKTISNTNLPRPASSFVGRDDELLEVLSRFEDGARLVTLTGPGGTGKTRLAIEAAATLVPEFKAGVFWVGLATLRDPALVTETIAQTLGAKDELAEHIGERELLLLLDNLEQVIDCAPQLSALLEACPNLKLLVTSRELLRIRGEVEYAVPPLAEAEAVALFGERSQLEPDDTIAELCRRLDDMPLAVELAAARTSVLTPEQILERLSPWLDLLRGGRDADPRQQTLRSTIEWSYELLTREEQHLFARLSVFAGGCTLEAAEQVCDADIDTLQSLVEKSLIRFTDGRYWMLETIGEFAAERLEVAGEAGKLQRSHAENLLTLADDAESHADPWINRLDAEQGNFRAALDRLEAAGELDLALRLAGTRAMTDFWASGHVAEGRQRLERLLVRAERPSIDRARALAGAAVLARQAGDAALVKRHAGEALELFHELGDAHGVANATVTLGLAFADVGDFARAREVFEESVRLCNDAGDESNALFASRCLAWMHEELGEKERAWALYEHNLSWARALGNKNLEAQALGAMAGMALDQGRAGDAVSLLKDVLRIDRDTGEPFQTSIDLTRFARGAAFAGGRDADAARLLSCAEAVRREMGAGGMPNVVRNHEEALAIIRGRLNDDVFAKAWQEGRKMSLDDAIALALTSLD